MLGMILCLWRRLLMASVQQMQSLVKLFQPMLVPWHLPIQLPNLGESSPELERGGSALGTGDWPHRMAWFDGDPVTYLMNLIRWSRLSINADQVTAGLGGVGLRFEKLCGRGAGGHFRGVSKPAAIVDGLQNPHRVPFAEGRCVGCFAPDCV